jgi:hypothetical protein
MARLAVILLGMTLAAPAARAVELPSINIEAYCATVGGGDDRVARCIDNEKAALLWFETRNIDIQILYQCTRTLGTERAGYVLLRSCVLSKSGQ